MSQRKIIRFRRNFVHSSILFWTGWTSRDQKWKSCTGQTPSSTERISCSIGNYISDVCCFTGVSLSPYRPTAVVKLNTSEHENVRGNTYVKNALSQNLRGRVAVVGSLAARTGKTWRLFHCGSSWWSDRRRPVHQESASQHSAHCNVIWPQLCSTTFASLTAEQAGDIHDVDSLLRCRRFCIRWYRFSNDSVRRRSRSRVRCISRRWVRFSGDSLRRRRQARNAPGVDIIVSVKFYYFTVWKCKFDNRGQWADWPLSMSRAWLERACCCCWQREG